MTENAATPSPGLARFDGELHNLRTPPDVLDLRAGESCFVAGRVVAVEPEALVVAGTSAANSIRLLAKNRALPQLTSLALKPGDIVVALVRSDDSGLLVESLQLLVEAAVWTEPTTDVPTRQGEVRLYGDSDLRRVLESTDLLLTRIRAFLHERHYLEVQLPVLNEQADISPNIPFATTSVAGSEFHLRTTFPYFERLFFSVDRAFQIGPMFRDELAEVDREPEFNMLCLGSILCDYEDMMDLGEELVADLAAHVIGRTEVQTKGASVRLDQPWRRRPLGELLEEHCGITVETTDDLASLWHAVHERSLTSVPEPAEYSQLLHSRLLDALLKEYVYPTLIQPTFVTEFPYYYGGPACPVRAQPESKMRAEAFVGGVEVGETVAFLTDSQTIERWHSTVLQEKSLAGWSQEADQPFLDTMRRGIFPSAVIALGIERLLMLLLETPDIAQITVFPGRSARQL